MKISSARGSFVRACVASAEHDMQTPKISATAARLATFIGCREWTTPIPNADAGMSMCIRASANTSRPAAMRCGGMHMSCSKLAAATSIKNTAQTRPADAAVIPRPERASKTSDSSANDTSGIG